MIGQSTRCSPDPMRCIVLNTKRSNLESMTHSPKLCYNKLKKIQIEAGTTFLFREAQLTQMKDKMTDRSQKSLGSQMSTRLVTTARPRSKSTCQTHGIRASAALNTRPLRIARRRSCTISIASYRMCGTKSLWRVSTSSKSVNRRSIWFKTHTSPSKAIDLALTGASTQTSVSSSQS